MDAVDNILTQGRRDLLCGEISKAVEHFQKACEMISSEFGDFDDRLATPNLLYGTALLELARIESSVIGNALDGIPENQSESSDSGEDIIEPGPEMTSEEKEDLSNQVIDAMCEDSPKDDVHEPDEEAVVEPACDDAEGDGEVEETEEEDDNSESDKETNDETNDQEGVNQESGATSDKSEDEDEVTNLQIAWEVIEVAKKIFSKKDDDKSKLCVAECLEKLGEISREKEDYAQAISDLKDCLSIRTSILGDDDREVAEVHFQLGTTFAVSGDLDEASSSFRSSAACLKRHADDLKNKLSAAKEVDDAEQKSNLEASLLELESLIRDVESRCADIEEDRLAEKLKPSEITKDDVSENGASLPADDITHLIRKKRSTCDRVTENINSSANGDPVNTKENGHVSPTLKKAKYSVEVEENETVKSDV